MEFLPIVSCLLAMVNLILGSNEVPVIVWGRGFEDSNFHVPAHQKLSTSEFRQNFLEKLIHNEPVTIAAFIEESLSPEDLVSQDSDEESRYPFLQKTIESDDFFMYLPYVSSPIHALETLNYDTYELSSSGSLQSWHSEPHRARKLLMIKLDDALEGEGRLKLLQRHDKTINKFCSEILRNDGSICILTAKHKSWIEPEESSHSSRKLLQVADPEKAGGSKEDTLNVYYQEMSGMVYTKDLPTLVLKNENKVFNLTIPTNPNVVKGNNALVLYLESSANANDRVRLSFNFVLPNMTSTWQLGSVVILYPTNSNKTKLLKATSYIGASIGNSFHSPSNITFEGNDSMLTFRGLQAQYFATSNPQVFGPAEDSVYFFTVPILSGLFVTSLLVTIVLIGLTMIFDVKTMDQFDDPKGKSITINASD